MTINGRDISELALVALSKVALGIWIGFPGAEAV